MSEPDVTDADAGAETVGADTSKTTVLQPVADQSVTGSVVTAEPADTDGQMRVLPDAAENTGALKSDSAPKEDTGNGVDYGDWKYEPWKDLAHWHNAVTGETTFDEARLKRENP